FSNLISDVATNIRGGAHIHVAPAGQNGPIVIELSPTIGEDGRGGTFTAENNTFDLSTLEFPEGHDANSVRDAIVNGNAYVNVHTEAYGSGEIRGQLLPVANDPPNASEIVD